MFTETEVHNCPGVRHEGIAEGQVEKVGEIDCYTATPTGDFPKDKVLLFLADGFGINLINSKLRAQWVQSQPQRLGIIAVVFIQTVAPDILNGDPLPEDFLDSGRQFPFADWLKLHGPEQTRRPTIGKVITALKGQGVTHLAATGYCFGGRFCFDLAFENVVDVVAVSPPSLLKTPEDLEKYAQNLKGMRRHAIL